MATVCRWLWQVDAHSFFQGNKQISKVNESETDKQEIIKNLIEQVTGTVRWRETMAYFSANGVTDLVELGAGKVLSGMAKRSLKDVNSFSVYGVQDIEELAKNL